ncbi:MAG: DegQ family serine endoprotease [Limisphaerales bacterium]
MNTMNQGIPMYRRNPLSRGARAALLGAVLLAAVAGVVFTQAAGARENNTGYKARDLKLNLDSKPAQPAVELRASFAPVIKGVSPSVVNVFTSTKPRRIEGNPSPFGGNPFFREFFGDPGSGMGRSFQTPRQEGLGSGVILTEDGFILTNNHVVEGADSIKVALNPDGKEYDAEVVGRDPKSDLAVIKISADGLAAIPVGDSDRVEVGDVVLAVGNPFGVGQTVTMGIVGATSRAVFGRPMGLEYEDFIQTDAAINPGNSGGALVDAAGRLIGINTAIMSRGGGNNGVGFAVPINLARSVMESIVEHGRVVRGFLGVNIQDVTPAMAKAFSLKESEGALVADITPKSPAEKAGIEPGDVVIQFDGREVRDSRHLKLMVGQTPPEKEVTLSLLRDGKPQNLDVVLRELPEDGGLASLRRGGPRSAASDTGGLQGVVVSDVNAQMRQQFGLSGSVRGAVVTDVDEESAAWKGGLRPGDVLVEINRQPVRDAESAIEIAQSLENSLIRLRVWRDGANRFVVVDETKS